MQVLILLEDEKYFQIANQIKDKSNATVEISNIDFDLTKSLQAAQSVILLGSEQPYLTIKSEYYAIIKEKLFFTTYDSTDKDLFEVKIDITNGLVICQMPQLDQHLMPIVSETCHIIFDRSLKVVETTSNAYPQLKATIEDLERELQNLIDNNNYTLSNDVIEEIFHNYKSHN